MEGRRKDRDGWMHVAMEMTFEPRMTFDPWNLHKPNILLQHTVQLPIIITTIVYTIGMV